MDKKEQFKTFVKSHPELIRHVKNGSMTWQKFYEIYDMYGDDEKVWSEYFFNETTSTAAGAASVLGISEIFNWLKKIDLDNVRSGIGNIQKVVGLLQDFTKKDEPNNTNSSEYRPRPIYRSFED